MHVAAGLQTLTCVQVFTKGSFQGGHGQRGQTLLVLEGALCSGLEHLVIHYLKHTDTAAGSSLTHALHVKFPCFVWRKNGFLWCQPPPHAPQDRLQKISTVLPQDLQYVAADITDKSQNFLLLLLPNTQLWRRACTGHSSRPLCPSTLQTDTGKQTTDSL